MLTHLIRGLLYRGVGVCTRWHPPGCLGPLFTASAVVAIRAYRLLLSPFVGRDCMFEPSCSRYAQNQLTASGWVAGWQAAFRRLSDCGGNYVVLTLVDGRRLLKAGSGRCYSPARSGQANERWTEAEELHEDKR